MSDGHGQGSAYTRTRLTPDPHRRNVWRSVTRYLSPLVRESGAVLDLGAGYCDFINNVQARRRVAVDQLSEVSHWAGSGVESFAGDAIEYLNYAEQGEFDFIMASNFLEHFEWDRLEILIALIVRALAPGGRLVIIQPNFRLAPKRYFDDYTHRTVFTDVSVRDWLEANGLRVLRVVPGFLPLTMKSRLRRFSFLVPLYIRLPWRPFAGQMLVLAERPPST